MMKFKLLIFLLLLSSSSFAFLTSSEKKIDIAIEKYKFGYYDECITISNKFADQSNFTKHTVHSCDAFALKAASYFRQAEYSLYKKTISEWANLLKKDIADSLKSVGSFKLAQLYLEVGNINACDSVLKNISASVNEKLKSDILFVRAGLLFQQGNIFDASKIVTEQLNERKNEIGKTSKKDNYLLIVNNNKKIYSNLVFYKIKIAIAQGELDSADVFIKSHDKWIKENLHDEYYERELIKLSAELELTKNNIDKAYELYHRAYQYSSFLDVDYKKNDILSSIIILSNRIGLSDQSHKFLRRLQMFAYVISGKQEPFQYAYEGTLIQLAIENNKFSEASDRIEKFADSYNKLPGWHPVRLKFANLESDLLLYRSKLNIDKNLDSLLETYKQQLGSSHEFIAKLLIEKISYELYYGSSISNVKNDLKALNDNFISKGFAGNLLLQYYELNSVCNFLLDDFQSYKTFAEKAYTYSIKLYGKDSEKIFYYHAVYLKSLLYSGTYKEFYSQFSVLKKSFASTDWLDKEEKRKSYLTISEIYDLIGEKDDNKSILVKMAMEMDESGQENIYAITKTQSQLAVIYFQSGNLFKADKIIKQSLENKKSAFPDNSVAFIDDYFFVAMLELQKGNYKETEKNLDQASEIISNAYGKNSRLYAEYLKLLADYCIAIGDFERGNEYINKSQTIILNKFGKDDLSNVSLLVRKAYVLSQNQGDKLDSKLITSLYKESLRILSSTIGNENFYYADVLKKNAHFFIKINKLNSADSILTTVEAYWKKVAGNSSQELLDVYLLKGDINYEKGNYEKANSYYDDVKSIAGFLYDSKNIYYTRAYARQAKVAYMNNKPIESLNIMQTLLPRYLNFVSKNFPSLSFREKSNYWNNMKDEFEFYVSLVLSNPELRDKYSKDVYNTIISTKAILLSNNIKVRERILSSGDTLLINAYNNWISLKEYYTSVSSLTKAEQEAQKIDLNAIVLEIEKREKHLSNKSELFKTEDKISNATLKDISAILSSNEYAIELVRYRKFYKHFTDTINYAAIIAKEGSVNPEVVIFPNGRLFETKSLKLVRNAARFNIIEKNSYNSFWGPLQKSIPDGSTVFLSAEGSFNLFNLEMLSDSTKKFLLDKIELVLVTNTKDLLRSTNGLEKQKRFDASSEVILSGDPTFYYNDNTEYDSKLPDLPGTAKEIEQISEVLGSSKFKVVTIMGDSLTEDRLKKMKSPKVFHIATHGFYSEVKNNEEENNSMLNSGLLLRNSGSIISSGSHVNSKDGILTAYEAMNLNMDHTDLVVLSACETGLGELKAGEGIYGLQRSFLISGSKAIILSLYKVNDEITQELMTAFYSNWVKSGDIRKSFIAAKQKIKNAYPDKPVYWGAFILIEGQPQLKRSEKKNGRL